MKKTKNFIKNHFLVSFVFTSFIYFELVTITTTNQNSKTQIIIINLLAILSLWSYLRILFTSPGYSILTTNNPSVLSTQTIQPDLHSQLGDSHQDQTTSTNQDHQPTYPHPLEHSHSEAPSPTLLVHQSTTHQTLSDTDHTKTNNPPSPSSSSSSSSSSQPPRPISQRGRSDQAHPPSKPPPVFISPSQETTQPATVPSLIHVQSQKEPKPSIFTRPLLARLSEPKTSITQAIHTLETNPAFIQFCTNQFTIYFDDQYLIGNSTNPKLCKRCRLFKPPRSHHCRRCDACVLKMDHHCPWVGRCVGAYNYKFFLNFLQWTSIYCITILIVMTIKLAEYGQSLNDRRSDQFGKREPDVEEEGRGMGALTGSAGRKVLSAAIISAVLVLFISSLLVTHLHLLIHGLTTLEHMADRKFKANLVLQILHAFPDAHQRSASDFRIRIWSFFFHRKLRRVVNTHFTLYRKTFILKHLYPQSHPEPSPSSLSAIDTLLSLSFRSFLGRDSRRFYSANWQSVMGRQPLRWILPIRPSRDHRYYLDPGLPAPQD